MNNISICISIFSLILSAFNTCWIWYQQHLPIKYSLDWICNIADGKQLDIGMTFVNPSSKPYILLDLAYIANNNAKPQHSTWMSNKILEIENTLSVGGKEKRSSYKEAFSDFMPMVIAPYSAKTIVLAYPNNAVPEAQKYLNFDIKLSSKTMNVNLPIGAKISTSYLKTYLQDRLTNQ